MSSQHTYNHRRKFLPIHLRNIYCYTSLYNYNYFSLATRSSYFLSTCVFICIANTPKKKQGSCERKSIIRVGVDFREGRAIRYSRLRASLELNLLFVSLFVVFFFFSFLLSRHFSLHFTFSDVTTNDLINLTIFNRPEEFSVNNCIVGKLSTLISYIYLRRNLVSFVFSFPLTARRIYDGEKTIIYFQIREHVKGFHNCTT